MRVLLMEMKILISNDDGIYSPGIAALAKVAATFGDVRIVAPDVEQSSMSHAITSTRPYRPAIAGFHGEIHTWLSREPRCQFLIAQPPQIVLISDHS